MYRLALRTCTQMMQRTSFSEPSMSLSLLVMTFFGAVIYLFLSIIIGDACSGNVYEVLE